MPVGEVRKTLWVAPASIDLYEFERRSAIESKSGPVHRPPQPALISARMGIDVLQRGTAPRLRDSLSSCPITGRPPAHGLAGWIPSDSVTPLVFLGAQGQSPGNARFGDWPPRERSESEHVLQSELDLAHARGR
jgi:hypothetical protein